MLINIAHINQQLCLKHNVCEKSALLLRHKRTTGRKIYISQEKCLNFPIVYNFGVSKICLRGCMNYRIRRNTISAQHVDVALVYKEMLGVDEAMAYLMRANIPECIAERVLHTGERRMRSDSSTHTASSAQPVNCRRKNHLHDAIVEAAVKIEAKLGKDWAISLLKQEEVPAEVAERILAQGPRQLRRRKNAS